MKLFIARHGETQWNLEGCLQGGFDSPLTDKGKAQAKALAQTWADNELEVIYASGSQRAQDTAAIIADCLNIEVRVDDKLKEQEFGGLQGLMLAHIEEQYPDLHSVLQGENPHQQLPDGESLYQAGQRLLDFCQWHIEQNHYRNIAVVSHGNSLKGLVWHLVGKEAGDARRFCHLNGSFNEIEVEDGQMHLRAWSVSTHLLKCW